MFWDLRGYWYCMPTGRPFWDYSIATISSRIYVNFGQQVTRQIKPDSSVKRDLLPKIICCALAQFNPHFWYKYR
jgi:hypothetical protein